VQEFEKEGELYLILFEAVPVVHWLFAREPDLQSFLKICRFRNYL